MSRFIKTYGMALGLNWGGRVISRVADGAQNFVAQSKVLKSGIVHGVGSYALSCFAVTHSLARCNRIGTDHASCFFMTTLRSVADKATQKRILLIKWGFACPV